MEPQYPITVEVDYSAKRSRWKAFLRYFLAIPWLIWGAIISIGTIIVNLIAWFAIVITGRYPAGMYNFSVGAMRYANRVNGFTTLLTDVWPPFDLGEHPEYPVRARFAPRPERQSRLKAFFRFILVIPIDIVYYVFSIVSAIALFVAWIVCVIAGKQPEGLQTFLVGWVGYQLRFSSYHLLLRDEYPPLFRWNGRASVNEDGTTSAVS